MGASGPKTKKVPSAKELANLQPNPQHLKKGGSVPRDFVTQPHLDFLNYLIDGATKKDAWRWAGLTGNSCNCHELLKRPLIASTFKELKEKRKEQSVDEAAKRREERDILLHNELAHRLRTFKTHKFRGDEAVVKLIEVGFKSTGAILGTRVTATAASQASASAEMKPLYVPIWRQMQIGNPAQTIEGETVDSAKLDTSKPSPA